MKILLLIDKPNWAYHHIAKGLIKYNNSGIEFVCQPIKKQDKYIKKIYKKYDLFYVFGYKTYGKINFLPKNKTMVGVHSCKEWDDDKTTPTNVATPQKDTIKYLNSFLRVGVVSQYIYDVLKKSGVNNLYYTPNGVDSNLFVPQNKIHKEFTIGYAGVKSHDWLKGITEFIIPASKRSKVQTHLALRLTKSQLMYDQMPNFYNMLDAYVCASTSEGFSLSVLEAASCGIPIISTRVSGCKELIRHGENGFFVDRSVEDISRKIDIMKDLEFRKFMSENMRKDIVENHCWSVKIDKWIDFFKGK